MTELDKSTSQLDPIDPLTGDELVAVTQGGQSRKGLLSQIIAYLQSGASRVSWGNIIGTLADQEDLRYALDGKSNTGHTHSIAQVAGLQADLNNRAPANHGHSIAEVAGLQADLNNRALANHIHSIAQVTGLQADLNNRALANHGHSIAEVEGLQDALDGKADSVPDGIYSPLLGLYESGFWYNQSHGMPHIMTNHFPIVTGDSCYFPFVVHEDVTFTKIAMHVNDFAVGASAQIAIYASDAQNEPADRLFLSPSINCSTVGDKILTISPSLVVPARTVLWIGFFAATGGFEMRGLFPSSMRPISGSTDLESSFSAIAYLGTSQAGMAANGTEIRLLSKGALIASMPAISMAV